MESSRWGSLLVRAAARRLINPADGCPITRKYALRELLVLQELSREEAVDLGKTMVTYHALGGQLVSKSPDQRVVTDLYEKNRDAALLTYYKLGALLHPWDESWRKKATELQGSIRERNNKIGDTNISGETVVKLIKQYEAAKKQWKRKRNGTS